MSISLSWLLMEKVCISWKVVGHLSYDIACGVKKLIPFVHGYDIDGEDLDLLMHHFVLQPVYTSTDNSTTQDLQKESPDEPYGAHPGLLAN